MFGIFKKKTPENGGGLSATAQLVADGDTAVLRFSGVWLLSKKRTPVDEIVQMITPDIKRLSFDTGALKSYDSALVGMLFRCYEACAQLGIEFDSQSLPKGPRELLKLAVAVPERRGALQHHKQGRRAGDEIRGLVFRAVRIHR